MIGGILTLCGHYNFSSEDLRSFFFDHTIGTMEQLKDVLGTSVDMTIYRKLRQLSYLTSYSHQWQNITLWRN